MDARNSQTETPQRSYRSSLRAGQAAATRDRIIDAAGALFGERGFARTTLAAIAAEAGVSIETVQAQGPKRELLGAALRRATLGRETDEPILAAPEARALAEAATPQALALAIAELVTGFNARTLGIWRAFASAAADDPLIDAEWSEVMAAVRRNIETVLDFGDSRGWGRLELAREERVAGGWILIGPETYEKLTNRLGWSDARYRDWLALSLAELIFP
jgi:AcrR family transcriptional regulator